MLLVPTTLAQSSIHGIGLFAVERIEEGAVLWEFTPGFDLELSRSDVEKLSPACQRRVLEYAYYNAQKVRYILCSDDARFINHSASPNTLSAGFGQSQSSEGRTVAARTILAGEEITEDYRAFDQTPNTV